MFIFKKQLSSKTKKPFVCTKGFFYRNFAEIFLLENEIY